MTIYETLDFSLLLNVMLFFLAYLVLQQFVYEYKLKSELEEEE